MKNRTIGSVVLFSAATMMAACGGDSQKPAAGGSGGGSSGGGTGGTPAAAAAVAAPAGGLKNIGDFSEVWTALYKQNEKAINDYEGMPVMEWVTPQMTFANAIFYDMLNLDDKEGRFEGMLPMAGFKGFNEHKGSKITFGSDHVLEKDGFGPSSKKGDRVVDAGTLDLDKKIYVMETYTERAGAKTARNYCEFKTLADGSMISLTQSGQSFNAKGEAATSDSIIYLHNGNARYDFVVGAAKTGPGFKALSFADKGDLTKEKALEVIKAAGYTVEKSGGIVGGKMTIDK